MEFSDRLRITDRYIHTGNSGAKFTIYRDERRTDRAKIQVHIGAMGLIASSIDIIGPDSCEYSGFTPDQLRDLANMFLYAANELERPSGEQKFKFNEDGNSIFKEERKDESISKIEYRKWPEDIVSNIARGFGCIPKFEEFQKKHPEMTSKDLLYKSIKTMTAKL